MKKKVLALSKNLAFCLVVAIILCLETTVLAYADSGPLLEIQQGLKGAGIFLGACLGAYGVWKFGRAYSNSNGAQTSEGVTQIVGGAIIIFGATVLGSIPLPF